MSLNIVIPLLNDSVVDLSRGEFRRHFKSSRGWKVDATPMIFARESIDALGQGYFSPDSIISAEYGMGVNEGWIYPCPV